MADLALLAGDDDVLVAAAALLGRAVDAAAGVHHVAHQVPVGGVSRRHDGQVQRQLQQLLHSLTGRQTEQIKHSHIPHAFTSTYSFQ